MALALARRSAPEARRLTMPETELLAEKPAGMIRDDLCRGERAARGPQLRLDFITKADPVERFWPRGILRRQAMGWTGRRRCGGGLHGRCRRPAPSRLTCPRSHILSPTPHPASRGSRSAHSVRAGKEQWFGLSWMCWSNALPARARHWWETKARRSDRADQPAIDAQALARDVARPLRYQKGHGRRDLVGGAIAPHRHGIATLDGRG